MSDSWRICFIAERHGRVENTDFLTFFLLNFGGAFSASVPRAYLNHKPLVFSTLHRKYTDSFIAAGLVAEIPELSGNLIAKCQILVSENNHVGVKGRDIQARQG